jgi:3-hydroxymyristoyl/3-hydroxydecanoyl-(acyl carrier protein) dehydratase
MINPEVIFNFNQVETQKDIQVNEKVFSWNVPANLPYFQGHFRDNPVLPAIALLDLSLAMINSLDSNLKRTFLTIKTAKFSEVIKPGDTLLIIIKSDVTNQSYTLDFKNQNETTVSKLNVQLT